MIRIPLRLRLFFLFTSFVVITSVLTFSLSYRFLLQDKTASLKRWQRLHSEHLRTLIEARLAALTATVQQSALTLVRQPSAHLDLDASDWQFLMAAGTVWTAPGALAPALLPPKAQAVSLRPQLDLSADNEWLVLSQNFQGASDAPPIPIQAKFRAALLFAEVPTDLQAAEQGGSSLALVTATSPTGGAERLWGEASTFDRWQQARQFAENNGRELGVSTGAADVEIAGELWHLAWTAVPGTTWQVVSLYPQSAVLSDLRPLVIHLGLGAAVGILLAMVAALWFARSLTFALQKKSARLSKSPEDLISLQHPES